MVGQAELKTMLLALWNMLDSVEELATEGPETVDEMVQMVFSSEQEGHGSVGLNFTQFMQVLS